MKPFHVCLLICDQPVDKVLSKYGNYDQIFREFINTSYQCLLNDSNSLDIKEAIKERQLIVEGYNCYLNEFPKDINKFDAYFITGSSFNAYDNEPWILQLVQLIRDNALNNNNELRKPWVGICFGHQILARAFNENAVIKNPLGWEVGPTKIQLNEDGKQFFNISDDVMIIQQMHQDHVVELPSSAKVLAFTERSFNQSFIYKNYIIGIQGHPEFNETMVNFIVEKRMEKGIFDLSKKLEVENLNLKLKHQGLFIGMRLVKFMLVG